MKKKTINKKKFINKGKMPTKRTINMARIGVESINPKRAAAGILVIIVFAALFSKFMVYDKLNALAEAEEEVRAAQEERDLARLQLQTFSDVSEEYEHYSCAGMTPEETAMVNRDEVISVLEKDLMEKAHIQSWELNGNVMELTLSDSTLKEINQLMQDLQAEEIVDICTVTTAETNELKNNNYDKVYATVLVYFKDAVQESEEGEDHEKNE